MKQLIGKCGFNCSLCPVYEPNILYPTRRNEISQKWKDIFDYEESPENIRCSGCPVSIYSNDQMLHPNCEIFHCAAGKNLKNCGKCKDYTCKNLDEYISEYEAVANAINISSKDFDTYLKPHIEARNIFNKKEAK